MKLSTFVTYCMLTAVLSESPVLEMLPTHRHSQQHHAVCVNNGTSRFLSLIDEMQMLYNSKEAASTETVDNNGLAWSYISSLREFIYSGEIRHQVLYNTADDKSSRPIRQNQLDLTKQATPTKSKANCTLRLNYSAPSRVMLVNDSSLQQLLKNEKTANTSTQTTDSAQCQILLLFAPWCPFSVQLAPHYNALGRIFPDLETLAINAVTLNYWNARFGTVAVPNVLLFHNGKFIAKYNYTEKTIESLTYFVRNFTNLNTSDTAEVVTDDYIGPVPTELMEQTDYYLILSWAVIVYAMLFGCYKYSAPFIAFYMYVVNLFNYDHNHLD